MTACSQAIPLAPTHWQFVESLSPHFRWENHSENEDEGAAGKERVAALRVAISLTGNSLLWNKPAEELGIISIKINTSEDDSSDAQVADICAGG